MLKIASRTLMRIAFCEVEDRPVRGRRRQHDGEMREQARRQGHHDVRGGPGRGDPDHVVPRIVQCAEIHRHRLGVAEQEGRVQEDQQARHEDRAERVDVLERIEGHAALLPGGAVAEAQGDEPVRGLVQRDGEDGRYDPGGDRVDRCRSPWESTWSFGFSLPLLSVLCPKLASTTMNPPIRQAASTINTWMLRSHRR